MEINSEKISHTIRPLNYKDVSLEEIFKYIDMLEGTEIRNINFNINMFQKMGEISNWKDYARQVKEYIDKKNMYISVVHAPYKNLLILSDNCYDEDTRLYTLISVDIANIFGAKKVVVHCGISYDNGLYNEKETIKQNVHQWLYCVEYAKLNGVVIAFENDVVNDVQSKEHIFQPSVIAVKEIVKEINKFNLNATICYDIGHANISHNNIIDDLTKVKEYLSCFHIHNNNGCVNYENAWKNDTHNPCFDGLIDMEKFFNRLKEINYKDNIIIESVYRDSGENLVKSIIKDYSYIKKMAD